jgi:SAM-dependent methyltransferase
MNLDFTGERIVPGKVDAHLYHEHLVRYLFAARLASGRRCLDLGCGSGYGAMELAKSATRVAAIDVAFDAVAEGRRADSGGRIEWCQSSATALPFAGQSFDLITAFEVIEHLPNWRDLLAEAFRLLSHWGTFLVSTPNREAYAELRGPAGANPFHVHEFDPDEFAEALRAAFPHVEIWSQWSSEANVIGGPRSTELEVEARLQPVPPADAVYLLGIAGKEPFRRPPGVALAHLSEEGNLLLERLRHIRRLEGELAQKDTWLREAQSAHVDLLDQHRKLIGELQQSNDWASRLNSDLKTSEARVVALQEELEEHQRQAALIQEQAELQRQQLESHTVQLARCVDMLHQAESQVEERTLWAQRLDAEVNQLRALLQDAKQSRWLRLGRRLSVGPRLP